MNSRVCISVMVVLLLLFTVASQNVTYADDAKPSEDVDYFGDGIVVFSFLRTSGIEGQKGTATLANAKLTKIGDRYFVRGQTWVAEEAEQRASHGVDTAFAWNDVIAFYVFSEEQLKAFIAERKDQ